MYFIENENPVTILKVNRYMIKESKNNLNL